MRVSDLVRQGRLVDLSGSDEIIDPQVEDGQFGEIQAKDLLSIHNNERIEVDLVAFRIEVDLDDFPNFVTISDWRQYNGIPTVYGRIIGTANEPFIVLQYWMYYAGSTLPQAFPLPGSYLYHEGDIEFFQVLINKGNKRPVGVSSGQHYYGESRHWSEIKKVNGRPVIHIAFGSHATHFSSENARTGEGTLAGFLVREENSRAKDKGFRDRELLDESTIEITPALIEEPSSSIFFRWKGRFGEFRPGGDRVDGPRAPYYRGPDNDIGLSMFQNPVNFHFTYLVPGSDFVGMVEALARSSEDADSLGKVIAGRESCSDTKERLVPKNISSSAYQTFYSVGSRNFEFARFVAERCSQAAPGRFFNSYFGAGLAEEQGRCLYHGENISDEYRRYIFNDVVQDGIASVDELFESRPVAKVACGIVPKPTLQDARAEEGDPVVFTATLDSAPDGDVTYYYRTYQGTAGSDDFNEHTDPIIALMFRSGERSKTITVRTMEDTKVEPDETFQVYLTNKKSELYYPTPRPDNPAVATGTILDDDGLPAPVPHISDASATEGEPLVFTVTLDEAPAASTTYYYATYCGTAGRGDYTRRFATALRFGPGQRSGAITVRTIQDSRFEDDETFAIYVTDAESKLTHDARPTDYFATATGTIRDDDERAPPMPKISQGSADEGESIVFTVTLDEAPAADATYYYATYRGTAGSDDYTGHFATALTFGGGRTSATITVRTNEDTQVEDDETFYVYLTDAESKLTPDTPRSYLARAAGVIRDDEPVTPTPYVSNGRADEGDSMEFAVVLDWAPTSSVTYYYATYRGTAGRDDYTGHLATALRFNAGERSKTITVRTTRDTRFENDETFYVYITDAASKLPDRGLPTDYLARATGTIRNDEQLAAKTRVTC